MRSEQKKIKATQKKEEKGKNILTLLAWVYMILFAPST